MPKKPWDKTRLDAEKIIVREYGITKKLELYKSQALLRKFSSQAKKLMSQSTEQAEMEKKSLLTKLQSLALVGKDAQLDDVLALELKNIMERRLQTVVLRKGLANTIKQARQFITHRHIQIGAKLITSPSFIVSKEDEAKISFVERSALSSPEHPERPEQIFKLKSASKQPVVAQEVKEEAKAEEPKTEVAVEVKSE